MITQHTFLPYCWVCEITFDHAHKEHRHHIIPQAYGGVDGPQVSLCDSHHSSLHFIALRLYAKKPFNELLTHQPSQDKRLIWLATCVYQARILVENDPNKRQVIVFNPKKETLNQLKELKRVYGKASRESLIEIAISRLYHQHFK